MTPPARRLDLAWIAAACVGALTAVFMLAAGSSRVADPDVWWIALAGERTLASGHVPTTNALAFTDAAHPWVMHEWLYGVVYALGVRALGLGFLGAFAVVAGGAALALVFRAAFATERPLLGAAVAAAAVLFFGVRLFSPRPAGMSIVLALAVAALAFRDRFGWIHAAACVALVALWTQLHGSFPLGVATLVVASATEPHDRRRRLGAAALALAATALNPYGLRLHGLVLGYATGANDVYAVIHRYVVEFRPAWQKPDPWERASDLARLLAVAAVALSALRSPRWRGRAALCLGLVPLAALSTRHIELCGLLACLLLAPHLAERFAPKSASRRAPSALALVALGPAVALGLAASAAVHGRAVAQWVDPTLGGEALARLAGALPPGAHVYAPFRSAGAVLWLGRDAGVRVFYDSRNDCYGREVAEAFFRLEYLDVTTAEAMAELETRGTDAVLVPEGHRLDAHLREAPGWTRVTDSGWSLWRRR